MTDGVSGALADSLAGSLADSLGSLAVVLGAGVVGSSWDWSGPSSPQPGGARQQDGGQGGGDAEPTCPSHVVLLWLGVRSGHVGPGSTAFHGSATGWSYPPPELVKPFCGQCGLP